MDSKTKRLERDGLREAVEPVRLDAARRFARYDTRSATNYRTVVRKTGVIRVEQRLGKTTGARPDFGRLQIRKALFPALVAQTERVIKNLDKQLDRMVRQFG